MVWDQEHGPSEDSHGALLDDGCQRDARFQGQQHLQFLLQDHFWWPGIANQIQRILKNSERCVQHEGAQSKAPLHLIIAMPPLELLHVDHMSIEMSIGLNQSPKVVNILVFQDNLMRHIVAYVTPNQTAKTVAVFLYQGCILTSGVPAKLLSDQRMELYEQHYLGVVQTHGD